MCLVGMWFVDDLVQNQLHEYMPRIHNNQERQTLLYNALVFAIAHNKVNALQALFEFRADLHDLDVGWKATFVEFSMVRARRFNLLLCSMSTISLNLQQILMFDICRMF